MTAKLVETKGRGSRSIDWVVQRIPALFLLLTIVGPASLFVIRDTMGVPFTFLMIDPNYLGDLPPHAGYFSHLTVLVWAGGGYAMLMTANVLALRTPGSPAVMFAVLLSAFTFLLTADDLFMLHEASRMGDRLIITAYALILLALILGYYRLFLRTGLMTVIVAAAFLAMSAGIDLVQRDLEVVLGQYRLLLEDGTKFIGAVLWLYYLWRAGVTMMTEAFEGTPERRSQVGL